MMVVVVVVTLEIDIKGKMFATPFVKNAFGSTIG